jgi:hypothetical protein
LTLRFKNAAHLVNIAAMAAPSQRKADNTGGFRTRRQTAQDGIQRPL